MNSFFSLTPKGERVQELHAQGVDFDEALSVADAEYSSDGMTLVSVGAVYTPVESLKSYQPLVENFTRPQPEKRRAS